MRKEVVLAVADAIECHDLAQYGIGFNMAFLKEDRCHRPPEVDKTGHNCGTIACIAGWTAILFDQDGKRRPMPLLALDDEDSDILGLAQDAMDLTPMERTALFTPYQGDTRYWGSIPLDAAVRTLRRLAATGKVVWDANDAMFKNPEAGR